MDYQGDRMRQQRAGVMVDYPYRTPEISHDPELRRVFQEAADRLTQQQRDDAANLELARIGALAA